VGKDEKPLFIYKFRTMVADAAQKGPGITVSGDDRVTRVGRLLRRTKLDELPQLINVLKGDMSLVGPRPEDPRYVAAYTARQRQVLSVRPGITSPASVRFRHEEELLQGEDWERTYREEILPAKLQIELEYIAHRSVWRDLGIIVQTFLALIR
jgi:lipopolysaccharide/colanic/teichoic acid biosynthesis glycosyltransferase